MGVFLHVEKNKKRPHFSRFRKIQKDLIMGKEKKAKKNLDESQDNGEAKDEISYEDRLKFVSVIIKPMASKKLAKKLYKCVKKGMGHKAYVRNGLKDVQSRIR